ncbi:MAG: cysteine--tRNA ligase [Candidatus Methanoplasma sp.]|jgi:cysteinyl-tRNA synthetase|nr:cysteine--tRNA ligase [Candidatus Methanoplasma sp.]
MSLTIHNNLTNKKEEFVPIEPGKVSMYVCGVTVYDDIHMGHARSMIVFDTVARYLRYLGYEVTHVTNFTDVDDKIINRANERGIGPLDLSAEYIKKYFEDASHLGINKADLYPKASESIDDIIDMVQTIIKNGYGYTTPDGSVYFEVGKVKNYGRLSNQKLEDMQSSGRVVLDDQKKNPMDFAVWKTAKPGECTWDSPWGSGRPGWHIECSAMIKRHLGDKIDIHGGGNDLIFPHHENEILQTEAVTGDVLANYWMHNGMLQVKDQKMSKSLGNFFKVEDVAKKFDSQTIRFYFLNTHYSSPLIYGEEAIIESQTALKRLWNNYRDLKEHAKNGPSTDDDITDLLEETRFGFTEAMNDDFNSRAAIEEMFQFVRSTNKAMNEKTLSSRSAAKAVLLLEEFDSILGVLPEDNGADDETLDSVMKILIELRKELRSRKQYDLADAIRNKLGEAGVILEDTSDGAKWKKT